MFLKPDPEISIKIPGPGVEVHIVDGPVLGGPRNAPIGRFLSILPNPNEAPIVGAVVNGELRELTFPVKMDMVVKPVTMGEADGMLIYRRSLVFLLETAFEERFPEASLRVDHSIASGAYYCQVVRQSPITIQELSELENDMRRLAEEDLPFIRQQIPLEEAISIFKEKGETEKVRLLTHRTKDYLTIYRLKDHLDYHHGYMVPSTGYLRWFSLAKMGAGFVLRFPRRHAPTQLLPMPDYPKLLKTFQQYGAWLDSLGISSVGSLDDAIKAKRGSEIVLVSEALHEQHVTDIARQIAEQKDIVRLVLIAGPSSSGKTTFSRRLAVQLLAHGVAPFPLEMDKYFIDRMLTPLNEEGEPDFESIQALNRDRLEEDLHNLIAGKRVRLPNYDFYTGKSAEGETVELKSGEMIIMEGIHGLNPELFPHLPAEQAFRIYASALTQLNLDRHNRISTTDTRLVRRIVRDARTRGYSAQQTIQRWDSVRRGEKRYIFPFQENCNVMFNSALVYELSALRPFAEPLLRQVQIGTQEYIEAKRLLALLEWFLPLEPEMVPDNSILREFIGGSILSDFSLWHNHSH